MTTRFSRREMIGRLGLAGAAAAWATAAQARSVGPESAVGAPAFDVMAFGAKADGTTLNTQAFQAAIDACTAAGGGLRETGSVMFRHLSPPEMILKSCRSVSGPRRGRKRPCRFPS